MSIKGPESESTAMEASARELYLAHIAVGFTEEQAMKISTFLWESMGRQEGTTGLEIYR